LFLIFFTYFHKLTVNKSVNQICIRGEPVPFRAYIPKEEVIMYRKDQKAGGRLVYKVS
jgi:hypothetical protein